MNNVIPTYDPETAAAIVEYMAHKDDPTQNAEGVRVGDLFYASWGYEQTNIDYFQVVALKGKHTAVIRQIGDGRVYSAAMVGESYPLRNHFSDDKLYTVRTRTSSWSGVVVNAPHLSGGHTMCPCSDGTCHSFSEYA